MNNFVILSDLNSEKIMNAFKTVQGKATARTIDSFNELVAITKEVGERIGEMPKTCKNGTRVVYNFQQHFPNSYKYRAYSTSFVLVFDKGVWKIDIDSIERDFCPNRSNCYMYNLYLSERAKEKILQRYM